jgi:hypothetical protein
MAYVHEIETLLLIGFSLRFSKATALVSKPFWRPLAPCLGEITGWATGAAGLKEIEDRVYGSIRKKAHRYKRRFGEDQLVSEATAMFDWVDATF